MYMVIEKLKRIRQFIDTELREKFQDNFEQCKMNDNFSVVIFSCKKG